jgi:hypothetical protein
VSRSTLAITIFGITLLSVGVVSFTSIRAASDDAMDLASSAPLGPGLERYVDPVRGFSFDYPAMLSLSEADDSDYHYIFGDTPDGETRLMIVICPYAQNEPPTDDVIRAQPSAPDITSPIEHTILPSGPSAFLFRRVNTPMGTTREAFFVRNQTAYQVSVVDESEELSNEILNTWWFASPTSL